MVIRNVDEAVRRHGLNRRLEFRKEFSIQPNRGDGMEDAASAAAGRSSVMFNRILKAYRVSAYILPTQCQHV